MGPTTEGEGEEVETHVGSVNVKVKDLERIHDADDQTLDVKLLVQDPVYESRTTLVEGRLYRTE